LAVLNLEVIALAEAVLDGPLYGVRIGVRLQGEMHEQ
jgi:hypothetical protein